MKMISVRSSAIKAVGYDPTTRQMRITFRQGRTYDFCNVPEDVYQGLMSARSLGVYYDHVIRDRYQC